MEFILILPIVIAFILTIFFMPKWIKKGRQIGLLWEDMNKFGMPKQTIASGGIVVVMTFVLGVLIYVAIRTFLIESVNGVSLEIFALLTTILLLALIGFIDDLFGWQHQGLSRRFRIFLTLFASIPLIVINAGTPSIFLPFLGEINLGLIYPLIFIPIGILGATTTYNFLAGFNGLEAGQGMIILSFLSFVAYATGSPWLSIIGLCMVAALLGFYFYNKFPAKVFPGDVMTFSVGGLIAIMAILGNFERIAMFIFIPYIIEFCLKARGKLKKHSFGIPNKDGSIEPPYKKVYSLIHLAIFFLKRFKGKVYERDVVYIIFIFQIIISLVALIVFKEAIFP